jgi:hypothetical protein
MLMFDPLIVFHSQALSSSDQKLQLTTLSTLYTLTLDAPDIISQHASSLITKYLRLAVSPVCPHSTLLLIGSSSFVLGFDASANIGIAELGCTDSITSSRGMHYCGFSD